MTEGSSVPAKRRGRSPAYPGIDLGAAVQRVRQLHERERQHPAPVETIARHWEYKSLNGPAAIALSALKKFGLLEDEGSGKNRKAWLTDLAINLIQNPSIEDRRTAIKEAALNPSFHQELWAKYGTSLPSDETLRWELTREQGFTETGADEFIREYRETIRFAELAEGHLAGTDEHTADEASKLEGHKATASAGTPTEVAAPRSRRTGDEALTTYAIPLPKNAGVVELSAKFPLTEPEWDYFMRLLEALKAGLVDDSAPEY